MTRSSTIDAWKFDKILTRYERRTETLLDRLVGKRCGAVRKMVEDVSSRMCEFMNRWAVSAGVSQQAGSNNIRNCSYYVTALIKL